MASKKKKEKDRYGIFKITNIDELFELSRNRRIQLSLNDFISIFLRVTELRLGSSLKFIYGLNEIQTKIEKEMAKNDEEDPSIGRLSLCLSRSKICMEVNFWVKLCDQILENRFDCDFDEVYAAMMGLEEMRGLCKEEWQLTVLAKVYQKLQIAIIHHLKLQKYNLKTLLVICRTMFNNGACTPEFLKEVEFLLNAHLIEVSNHFANNEAMLRASFIQEEILFPQFGMEYQSMLLPLLAGFTYYFAKADFESHLLYNFTTIYVSECIHRSKVFAQIIAIRAAQIEAIASAAETSSQQAGSETAKETLEPFFDPLKLDGNALANMLFFWNYMEGKNGHLRLSQEIKAWLIEELQKPDKVYDVENLNTIYKSFDMLDFDEIDRTHFQFFLEKKLFEFDSKTQKLQIEDIKEYLELRQGDNSSEAPHDSESESQSNSSDNTSEQQSAADSANEGLQLISKAVYRFLDELSKEQMDQFSAYSVYYFLHHIEEYDELKYFRSFLSVMPKFFLSNIDKLEFDEICYVLLIAYQNAHLIDDTSYSISYWNDIYYIKEHIKSIAFARGFKLDPSSYFSQLLHVVDMAEFFQGGEQ